MFSKNAPEIDWDWLSEAMSHRPQTPPGKSGQISVECTTHPAGKPLEVVSMRNALFMGQRPASVKFTEPITCRALKSAKRGTWMQDVPQEVYQAREPIQGIIEEWGTAGQDGNHDVRVLIGGLGLGVYSSLVLNMAECCATTVEISRDVIRLVGRSVQSMKRPCCEHELVKADIYEYARKLKRCQFDAAILDTWQPTGEICWTQEVIPLRRLVRKHVPLVFCWNEQEMIGQFRMGCRKLALQPKEMPDFDTTYRTVRIACEQAGLIDTQMSMAAFSGPDGMDKAMEFGAQIEADPEVQNVIAAFCDDIGSPEWEERFGNIYDRAAKMKQARRRKAKAAG